MVINRNDHSINLKKNNSLKVLSYSNKSQLWHGVITEFKRSFYFNEGRSIPGLIGGL